MTRTVELSLNPEVVSVTGVVNGESYTFALTGELDGMGIWSATVTRADDDIYRVSITAVNQYGVTTEISTTLYYGLHLITDRTQADVDKVNALKQKGWRNMTEEECSEWRAGLKGAYNTTDLNRVQTSVSYLRDRLANAGYPVGISVVKTWTEQDTPTVRDMTEYLNNVRAIREALAVMASTPQVPDTMAGLTYIKANEIEMILRDVEQLISNMVSTFAYSGDLYGGEK